MSARVGGPGPVSPTRSVPIGTGRPGSPPADTPAVPGTTGCRDDAELLRSLERLDEVRAALGRIAREA